MDATYAVSPQGLEFFDRISPQVLTTAAERLHAIAERVSASASAPGVSRPLAEFRREVSLHLEFFRPVIEFGTLEPFSRYLRWSAEVLSSRKQSTAGLGDALACLAEVFAAQRFPAGDGERVRRALHDALAALPLPGNAAAGTAEARREPSEFEQALLQGDRRRAEVVVEEWRAQGHSLLDIEVHLIQSALYNIGQMWQENRVSVTQEHLATATAQTVMADCFARSPLPPLKGRRVLLACVEGNEHSVGLRMISDAFELNGWEVQFAGANTPTRDLVEQVAAWRPHVVGLSIAFPHQLDAARDAIVSLRSRFGDRCPKLIVGGAAVNQFTPLAEYLGADGHAADALAVMELAS